MVFVLTMMSSNTDVMAQKSAAKASKNIEAMCTNLTSAQLDNLVGDLLDQAKKVGTPSAAVGQAAAVAGMRDSLLLPDGDVMRRGGPGANNAYMLDQMPGMEKINAEMKASLTKELLATPAAKAFQDAQRGLPERVQRWYDHSLRGSDVSALQTHYLRDAQGALHPDAAFAMASPDVARKFDELAVPYFSENVPGGPRKFNPTEEEKRFVAKLMDTQKDLTAAATAILNKKLKALTPKVLEAKEMAAVVAQVKKIKPCQVPALKAALAKAGKVGKKAGGGALKAIVPLTLAAVAAELVSTELALAAEPSLPSGSNVGTGTAALLEEGTSAPEANADAPAASHESKQ